VPFTRLPRTTLVLWRASTAARAAVLAAVAAGIAVVLPRLWSAGPAWLAWSAWAAAGAAIVRGAVHWRRLGSAWQFSGFSLARDAFWVRGGMWHRYLEELPYARVQAVEVESGPLQRRLGLASVTIATGAYHRVPLDDVDATDAERIRDVLSSAVRERVEVL
jgi:membrane protein YdbS with pleckstrin-like domain